MPEHAPAPMAPLLYPDHGKKATDSKVRQCGSVPGRMTGRRQSLPSSAESHWRPCIRRRACKNPEMSCSRSLCCAVSNGHTRHGTSANDIMRIPAFLPTANSADRQNERKQNPDTRIQRFLSNTSVIVNGQEDRNFQRKRRKTHRTDRHLAPVTAAQSAVACLDVFPGQHADDRSGQQRCDPPPPVRQQYIRVYRPIHPAVQAGE